MHSLFTLPFMSDEIAPKKSYSESPENPSWATGYLKVMSGDEADPQIRERVRQMIEDPSSEMNQGIQGMREEEEETRLEMDIENLEEEILNREKELQEWKDDLMKLRAKRETGIGNE